jgi:hypothetical protein
VYSTTQRMRMRAMCERIRGFGLFFLFPLFLTIFCRFIHDIFENEGTKIIQFSTTVGGRYSSLPLSSPLLSCTGYRGYRIQQHTVTPSLSLTSLSLSLVGTHYFLLGGYSAPTVQ